MELLKRIRHDRRVLADVAVGLPLIERRRDAIKHVIDSTGISPADNPKIWGKLKYWNEKERTAYQRRHHFKFVLRRELRRLARRGPYFIRIDGKAAVRGGTVEERVEFTFKWAQKHWQPYYSEEGGYDENYALTNQHHDGKRRDCSWDYFEARRAMGLKTLNTEPRYTGSALSEGKIVSEAYALTHAGVAVIFGVGDGFHMGTSTGHGPFIFEHGRPELDTGTFHEYSPVRFRSFD